MTQKILITSALPYVNNVPHLGNLVGCVLSADVFARFSRQMDWETLYICGSDEHGTATETKAKEAGVTPQELCDKYFAIHKEIYDWFDISFDIFGRTSLDNHKAITQELFKKVKANGFIEEDTVTQPYSVKSEMFLADRYIIGTCPHCRFEEATGDQCDNCGKLLTPQELIDPRAKIDGSTPEFRETKHLFLSLDTLQPFLEEWVKRQSAEGNWTENAIRTTNAWFKEGLKKRAISRDLKWGIPIPQEGYESKVFYVWFDAPIGYISITEQLVGEKYKEWWQGKEAKLYQFMGKDNIPFHSIIFPASLMAASDDQNDPDYNLVYHLDVTEYLNYENTKFSKSRNTGVFGDDAVKSGIPSDVYRYVLMFYRPENADTQFTWKGLQERLNNELIANFGNFVNRTLSFTNRFFESKTSALKEEELDEKAQEFLGKFRSETAIFIELLKQVKLRDALMQFMKISSIGNQYFQEAQPWKSRTENPQKAAADITLLVNAVKDLAIMCEPFLPATSKEIFSQLNADEKKFSDLGKLSLQDHTIGEAKVLFTKIEDAEIEELRKKFSGKQQETKEKKEKKMEKKETTPLKPSDVQFVVGEIIDIKQHPNADKLFMEQVNIGTETIQILSGLVGHYTAQELLHKKIFVVKNLKPAKMRGEMSHGMLLAAETEDESVVEVLDAADFEVGAMFSQNPQEEIDFGQFMTLKLDVRDHQVFLNDEPFLIGGKQLSTKVVKDGPIH
ncbi:MAG: methionine--tRNA ligase [Nanoarchaeota archaeon]|nr:methionine--tRNA ligase [Nanoarchaeota archaeon]